MIAGQIIPPVIRAVDLFCGVGGLTHGLIKGGIEVAAGYDVDPTCRYPYEANNEAVFVEKDITQLTASEIVDQLGDAPITMVAGCAPCQPFSTYSRTGRVVRGDADWQLVANFGRLLRDVRPHLITMENVPAVEHHPVFGDFLACLRGYAVAYRTILVRNDRCAPDAQAVRVGRFAIVERAAVVGLEAAQDGDCPRGDLGIAGAPCGRGIARGPSSPRLSPQRPKLKAHPGVSSRPDVARLAGGSSSGLPS